MANTYRIIHTILKVMYSYFMFYISMDLLLPVIGCYWNFGRLTIDQSYLNKKSVFMIYT